MPPLAQVAVMGAIVASLLAVFVTFGGAFNVLPGLVLWWLLVFAGACIYAAFLIPWGEKVIRWPKKG